MVRIRYTESNNLLSTGWFTLGPNHVVRGVINKDALTYEVHDINHEVVTEGVGKNIRELKYLLKKCLVDAGVNFDGEIRKRLK